MITKLEEPTTKIYSLSPSWGKVPAAHDQALRRLVRAIIVQAVKDASGAGAILPFEQFNAVDWLAGSECQEYCEFSGMNHRAVIAWLFDGAPYDRNKTKGLES